MSSARAGYFTDNVPYDDEIPLEVVPDVEWWTENFCFTSYDHKSHVGYFLHLGRWVHDPTIWREQVCFYMPDGTILTNRTFGKGNVSNGPGGINLRLECIESGKRWRLHYLGPAQPVTLPELFKGPVQDATEYKLVDLELEFEGSSPVWYFGEKENSTWGKWHIEQHGVVKGRLKVGAQEWDYQGGGYRDHSRGPRMLGPLRGHCWIQIRFPNGDQVASFQLWQDHDGVEHEDLSEASVLIGGERHAATITTTPRLMHPGDVLDERELAIDYDGKRLKFTCIPVSTLVYSVAPVFSHTLIGMATGNTDWPVTVFNQPAIFVAEDGRRGEGWLERCLYRHDRPYNTDYVNQVYGGRQ